MKLIKKALSFSMFFLPIISFAEIVVVANPELPVNVLTQIEINQIYLGKKRFLPNGHTVCAVDQPVGSSIRDQFYKNVINKTATQITTYWSRIIFTGQGYPPIQKSDDKSVIDLIGNNPHCIGYVDKSAVNNSVKVVFRDLKSFK